MVYTKFKIKWFSACLFIRELLPQILWQFAPSFIESFKEGLGEKYFIQTREKKKNVSVKLKNLK